MSQKVKILVIEDDKDTAAATRVTLETRPYQVLLAADTEEGLRTAVQEKPALIILDVMFGKKEQTKGFDCAVKLKMQEETARIPILMMTAVNVRHPTFHFRPETDGEYLPVDDFIDKPAQPQELLRKVEDLLAQGVSRWTQWPKRTQVASEPDGR